MGITHRENLDVCKDRIVFNFDKEKITTIVDEIAAELAKNNAIKGFRKGKAPISAIKNVAKKSVLQFAENKLANEAFEEILYETKLKPFGTPNITKISTTYDSFTVDMHLSYYPEFELSQYKEFELNKPELPDVESLAEKTKDNIRKQYPNLRTFEEDEFVMDGDSVIVDYESTIDGKEYDNCNSSGVPIEIGAGAVIRDFEVNLFGMKVGEEREFDVEFPTDTDASGKTGHFKVKLVAGVKKDLPEFNEELAIKVGSKSLEELNNLIDNQVNQNIKNIEKNRFKQQIVDNLLKSNTIALPMWMLLETAHIIARNHSVDFEKADEHTKEHLIKDSEKVLKLNMILEAIRNKEPETELSTSEISKIINASYMSFPPDVRAALNDSKTSNSMMQKLYSEIQDEQVYNWIFEHSSIKDNEKDSENA